MNTVILEIAAEAGISKMTVFNYFPTKDDIVVGPMEEHVDDWARIAGGRAPGETVVAAFRRVFLERLAARAPETGLSDNPVLLQVINIVKQTPALVARLFLFHLRSEQLLIAALAGRDPGSYDIREPISQAGLEAVRDRGPRDLRAQIVAGQLASLWRALQSENSRRIVLGETADEVYADAVAAAHDGFDLLEEGLRDYGVRG